MKTLATLAALVMSTTTASAISLREWKCDNIYVQIWRNVETPRNDETLRISLSGVKDINTNTIHLRIERGSDPRTPTVFLNDKACKDLLYGGPHPLKRGD